MVFSTALIPSLFPLPFFIAAAPAAAAVTLEGEEEEVAHPLRALPLPLRLLRFDFAAATVPVAGIPIDSPRASAVLLLPSSRPNFAG